MDRFDKICSKVRPKIQSKVDTCPGYSGGTTPIPVGADSVVTELTAPIYTESDAKIYNIDE